MHASMYIDIPYIDGNRSGSILAGKISVYLRKMLQRNLQLYFHIITETFRIIYISSIAEFSVNGRKCFRQEWCRNIFRQYTEVFLTVHVALLINKAVSVRFPAHCRPEEERTGLSFLSRGHRSIVRTPYLLNILTKS